MGRRRLEIKEVIGSGVPQPSAAHDSPGHGVCIGASRSTRDACPPMPLVVMLDVCRLERDGGSRGRASWPPPAVSCWASSRMLDAWVLVSTRTGQKTGALTTWECGCNAAAVHRVVPRREKLEPSRPQRPPCAVRERGGGQQARTDQNSQLEAWVSAPVAGPDVPTPQGSGIVLAGLGYIGPGSGSSQYPRRKYWACPHDRSHGPSSPTGMLLRAQCPPSPAWGVACVSAIASQLSWA